ncbi:MAG: hypothetical protein C4531_01355 [Desulfurivibrio sp.]|nr:MAG: hypothetical protein C4531_01355 [Desulfurivibrio sp.]
MEEVLLLGLAGSGRIFPWSALDDPGMQAEMIACQGNFIIPLDFWRLPRGRLHKISDMTHIISPSMKGRNLLLASVAGITTDYLIYAFKKKYVNH